MQQHKRSLTHLLTFSALLFFFTLSSQAATLTVGDPLTLCTPLCDYDSVKTAVQNASAGDTIEIQAGTYAEGKIVIDKDLTLKAAPGASVTLDANG